jgi:hypothetical protein
MYWVMQRDGAFFGQTFSPPPANNPKKKARAYPMATTPDSRLRMMPDQEVLPFVSFPI